MAEKITSITDAKEAAAGEEESLTVVLTKEYNFEGDKISEIDFSGLEDVTAKTMIKASKALTTSGDIQILPENSLHYALIIAAECTKWPIEFYEQLRPNDAIKVKNTVTNFFYGDTSE
ncbi:MAG: phage tail assembly protein [Clostridiales bacterium]|nr:phage tail assembly protein [Clostridiales bacterium]